MIGKVDQEDIIMKGPTSNLDLLFCYSRTSHGFFFNWIRSYTFLNSASTVLTFSPGGGGLRIGFEKNSKFDLLDFWFVKTLQNKIGLLLCHSHIEMRLSGD